MERRLLFADQRKRIITQRELEKRLSYPPGLVAKFETGQILADVSEWEKLEAELDKVKNEQGMKEEVMAR